VTPIADILEYVDGQPAPGTVCAGGQLGVDRAGQTVALRRHGADVVVADLAELLAPSSALRSEVSGHAEKASEAA
jgi:hypothetical protein